jgi:hypothetical protein
VPQDPHDTGKTGLFETQSPIGAIRSPTGITSEAGAMACEGRGLAPIATSSLWAVTDEVKQGDEWVPYVGG